MSQCRRTLIPWQATSQHVDETPKRKEQRARANDRRAKRGNLGTIHHKFTHACMHTHAHIILHEVFFFFLISGARLREEAVATDAADVRLSRAVLGLASAGSLCLL